jgi:putative PIN family toxin of toxin-antitoxin system
MMLVLLDSNVIISAMLSIHGASARAVDEWRDGRFQLLTCQHQIDEIRTACRAPKFRDRLQPHHIGNMLNHLYGAKVWLDPIPRKHKAKDPTDSFLLDLIDAAQPDYAVTGDKRAGLLHLETIGRTRIMRVSAFRADVLHL